MGLFVSLLTPFATQAFAPESATASRLSDDVLMYTLTYELGYDKYELRTPVAAKHDEVMLGVSRETTFAFLDRGKDPVALGSSAGVVLSTAKIEAGQYVVPKGERATFTLLALVTLPHRVTENLDPILTITSLPFILTSDEGVILERGLNASELVRYRTDEIDVDIR